MQIPTAFIYLCICPSLFKRANTPACITENKENHTEENLSLLENMVLYKAPRYLRSNLWESEGKLAYRPTRVREVKTRGPRRRLAT